MRPSQEPALRLMCAVGTVAAGACAARRPPRGPGVHRLLRCKWTKTWRRQAGLASRRLWMAKRAAMLAPAIGQPRLAPLRQLTRTMARPAGQQAFDWNTPIDLTRSFYCETLTPLYYTPVYRILAPEHRLRYNQLTGMLSNELILLLETGFLDAVLQAAGSPRHGDCDGFVTAIHRFREDERRHAEIWRRLNRLSAPSWYASTDRHLVRLPPGAVGLSRITSRHPRMFPFVFWIQLAQEERSVDISRR